MAAILPYAKMTRRLSPEEFFEFCNSIIRRSQADVVLVARLALRYTSFHGAFTVYDKGFKRPLKAPETKKIKELDTKRKGFFSLIDDDVRKLAKIAVDPAVLEAADFIIPLLDNYACTPKIEYEGETG
ncbi:MAG: hypothetical protein LBC81_00670, partial [Tannerellaceae bacterium]|nr:hypothetical protein [Tannerellaceae bacterium]